MEGVADTRSELLFGGSMGTPPHAAFAGDDRILFKRQRSGHDLAVYCPDRQGIKGTLTRCGQPPHQLLRSLGRIDRAPVALLDQPYLLGKTSPLIEKA